VPHTLPGDQDDLTSTARREEVAYRLERIRGTTLEGCRPERGSAKTILAINTDPDAPMVTKATHAVIGDLHEVIPAVNAEIRRRRG
jgi:hypothetical protein